MKLYYIYTKKIQYAELKILTFYDIRYSMKLKDIHEIQRKHIFVAIRFL